MPSSSPARSVIPASVDAKFRNREPVYPPEAVRRAEQGAVILLIHVSPAGSAVRRGRRGEFGLHAARPRGARRGDGLALRAGGAGWPADPVRHEAACGVSTSSEESPMVRIDVVVTRGGDAGETSLGDGARLRKDAPRIAAIGAVDEANAAIGVLRLATREAPDVGCDAGAHPERSVRCRRRPVGAGRRRRPAAHDRCRRWRGWRPRSRR